MDITIKTMTKDDVRFGFPVPWHLQAYIGYVGRLRGDFGSDDTEFFTTWEDGDKSLWTETFSDEFDNIINTLRKVGMPLNSRRDLKKYISSNPDCKSMLEGGEGEGIVRIDTDLYSYIIRLIPIKDDYNLYVYVYKRTFFDSYINRAKKGIRFIDKHYNELFRIQNGEKIVVNTWDGQKEWECWYIDEYHTIINGGTYHICQFAEMHEDGSYRPQGKEENNG